MEVPLIVCDTATIGPPPRYTSTFSAPDLRSIQNATKPSELYIYDDIGPAWLGMIDGQTMVAALAELTGPLTVRINSRGGDVVEGIAIYNAIRRYSKAGNPVMAAVDSLAASAASLIAMAGNTVEMASNGSMMVHQVWSFAWGNAIELRKVADILSHYDDNVAKTYAAKTELSVPDVLDLMKAETWMNAEEAMAAGFVDSIGDATDVAAPAAKASWYSGPEPGREKAKPKARKFGDLEAIDRSVQIRRKRLELL